MNRHGGNGPSTYETVGKILKFQRFQHYTFFPVIPNPRLVIIGADFLRVNDHILPFRDINKGSLNNLKSSFEAWIDSPEVPDGRLLTEAISEQFFQRYENWKV